MVQTVVGYIGPRNHPDLRSCWNERLRAEGRDAFFDFYRTKIDDLPLRLSEMFVLERRGYIVSSELSEVIVPLLDRVDHSVDRAGKVNLIINNGGILSGYFLDTSITHQVNSDVYSLLFPYSDKENG